MPTYEYKCDKCQRIEETTELRFRGCEVTWLCSCGGIMRRLFSPPAIIVKNPHPARKGRGRG